MSKIAHLIFLVSLGAASFTMCGLGMYGIGQLVAGKKVDTIVHNESSSGGGESSESLRQFPDPGDYEAGWIEDLEEQREGGVLTPIGTISLVLFTIIGIILFTVTLLCCCSLSNTLTAVVVSIAVSAIVLAPMILFTLGSVTILSTSVVEEQISYRLRTGLETIAAHKTAFVDATSVHASWFSARHQCCGLTHSDPFENMTELPTHCCPITENATICNHEKKYRLKCDAVGETVLVKLTKIVSYIAVILGVFILIFWIIKRFTKAGRSENDAQVQDIEGRGQIQASKSSRILEGKESVA